MIRTAIFGAGQAGRMVRNWLPPTHELLCYIDNAAEKQGTRVGDIPVLPPAEALELAPDRIWIASLNSEAALSIEKQLREAGYRGELRYARAFRDAQDIRAAFLRLISDDLKALHPEAAAAELGVYQGEFAAEINRLFPDRDLYLFDTYEGFSEADLRKEAEVSPGTMAWHPDFSDTGVEIVRRRLPHPEKARFVPGRFPESAEARLTGKERYIFVHIDPDLYEPTIQGLKYFWPRMVKNGILMIHDYNSLQFPGVRKAVREFAAWAGVLPLPLADLHGTAVITRP